MSVTVPGLLVLTSGRTDGLADGLADGDALPDGDAATAGAACEGACDGVCDGVYDGDPAGCEPDANPATLISTRQVSAASVRAATASGRRGAAERPLPGGDGGAAKRPLPRVDGGAAGSGRCPRRWAAVRPTPRSGPPVRCVPATAGRLVGGPPDRRPRRTRRPQAGSLAVSVITNAATSAGTDTGSGGSGRSRCAMATSSAPPAKG